MGKFKEMVTEEMTTKNVDFDTAVENLNSKSALVKAERAIRAAFTSENLDEAWNKSCVDKFNEMVATPRGRFFLRKGSPLNAFNKRPNVRF
jgi:hypothetical protein